jgi:serine/threonine protein kinase
LKVADFSFAQPPADVTERCGTPGQMAPEIENMGDFAVYNGSEADIFNAGFILFCMIFQRFPFGRASVTDAFYRHIFNNDSEAFWNL